MLSSFDRQFYVILRGILSIFVILLVYIMFIRPAGNTVEVRRDPANFTMKWKRC